MTKRIRDVVCPHCGKSFKNNSIRRHLKNVHNLTDVEWIVLSEKSSNSPRRRFPNIPETIIYGYLKRVYDINGGNLNDIWSHQFTTFHRIVTHCREFRDSDYNVFFDSVLPWQKEHPKTCNSRELCSLCFPTEEEFAKKAYHEIMETKNPYYKHGGKFSPFSKNFIGYEGMSDEQKSEAAQKRSREVNDVILHTTSLEYWKKKGYSDEDAKKMLSERQRTFTLEKCIAKYGEEDGKRIYADRQKKWLATLNKRYGDKWEELSASKSPGSCHKFSYESQALFWEIESKRIDKTPRAVFALSGESNNNEFVFHRKNGRKYFLDYCIPELKCVIEYDGGAWHNESTKEYDEARRKEISDNGYRIHVVTDVEYKTDREFTIKQCLDFIEGCKNEFTEKIC